MSVEVSELMSDEWTRWQGHVVNGVFPLGRPLGHSPHSGVYLTHARAAGSGQVAIKIMPAGHGPPEEQVARWQRAGQLVHPHLLALLESGACQLDGLPYLYVVMEYADQTLAQLLQRRALAAEEARDMLLPVLEALTFLHAQGLVQGGLTPTNVLVVGDRLKLASDTIRPAADGTRGQDNDSSAAGDIRALGASLFEALTCRSLPTLAGRRHSVVLPADFPPDFRDVVARCLSHKPQDRPSATELVAWMGGQALTPVPTPVQQPAAWVRPEAQTSDASPTPPLSAEPHLVAEPRVRAPARPEMRVAWRPVTLVATGILALGLVVTVFKPHRSPDAVPAGSTAESVSPPSATLLPATVPPGAPVAAPSARNPNQSDAAPRFAVHEQIPSVSKSAARTIHGHVKVSVRADITAGGTVSRVVVDQGARSRYFQQLAVKAAKKWTFPPLAAGSPRQVDIQFDFTRDGTSAHAGTVIKN